MPRKETRGSGFFARPVIVYDMLDAEDRKAFAALPAELSFDKWLDQNETVARAFLRKKRAARSLKLPIRLGGPDAPETVAILVLAQIRHGREAIARNDATAAADAAARLGSLITRDLLRHPWEKSALYGKGLRSKASKRAAQLRASKSHKASAWHQAARADAALVRAKLSKRLWSSNAFVAGEVKDRLKLPFHRKTIEKVIAKK